MTSHFSTLFCSEDFYNILEGPSHGLEMLNFFDEVLQEQRADGSALLERGDCVIMDNCGFHHGHRVEPVLTNEARFTDRFSA